VKGLVYRPVADSRGAFLPWVNDLRASSGAYVIRAAGSGQILYVGESHTGRLAKTIKRHFYSWKDDPIRRHFRYQPGRVEIAVRLCPPPAASGAQNNLILRLDPRDNTNGPERPF